MGCCSASASHDFDAHVSIKPELRIKIITSVQQCIDKGDRSWPQGLPYTHFIQSLALDFDDYPLSCYPDNWSNTVSDLRHNIIVMFEKALESREIPLFSNFLTFGISQQIDKFFHETDIAHKKHKQYKETIIHMLESEYFNININQNKETKQFVTFLLSYCLFDSNSSYDENGRNDPDFLILKKKSKEILNTLQIQLNQEYNTISECKTKYDQQLIELEYKRSNDEYIKIKSQRDLYPDFTNFSRDLVCRVKGNDNIIFGINYDDCIEEFRKYGLPNPDVIPNIWRDFEGNVYKNDMNIEFFRQIASVINPSFQEEMRTLFNQNRTEYKQTMGDELEDDVEAIFKSAFIKTNGRAHEKIGEDYEGDPPPQSGSILDWVRCRFVVYDTMELMMLYQKILKKYDNGEIIGVKNGFMKGIEGDYGYRVMLMNIIYEAKGFKMIVEVELVLLEYLKVKEKMQLFCKIATAEDCLQLAQDISRVTDIDKTKSKPWFTGK